MLDVSFIQYLQQTLMQWHCTILFGWFVQVPGVRVVVTVAGCQRGYGLRQRRTGGGEIHHQGPW
jgi:hypothetical protein